MTTENQSKETDKDTKPDTQAKALIEKGGPPGQEPVQNGEWVIKGKCVDF